MADYLNAIELAENLRERLEEVALSSIDIRDSELQNKLNEVIKSEDGLISEILVEGAFPAKKHTQTLNNIPFLNKKFLKLLDLNKVFDPNFYPYKHQYETLKIVSDMDENNKPAIVITAPTGSGKTESFLLPMLNDLISNPRKKGETGVRVIILYPMNALVADQNKRLFSYLKGQSKIRMFFYNSETPETEKYATDEFNDKCFVKTRKEARENPPDIMITNYSMLEYILARPNDYPLIGNALRTIIVDEAHIYTGTLAAEVSLLLRRVIAKAKINNSKVLYIATTATISDNKEEQQDFFSKFFNKSKNKIINVRGEKEFKEIDKDINVDNEIEGFKDISDLITKNNLDLYNKFKNYKIFSKILKILLENYTIKFNKLLRSISHSIDSQTLLNIFTIGAKARQNDNELPLLPHKLHLQVRSLQGFSICSNPKCPDSKAKGIGKIHHGIFYNCTTCKSPTLNLVKCSECGEHFFYGKFDDKDQLHLKRFITNEFDNEDSYFLSFKESSKPIYINKDGKKYSVYDYNNKFYIHSVCPTCSNDNFIPIGLSDQFLLPLVAETMLVNMPKIDKEINRFLPAQGRRLLIFSDSRSEAARLGSLLTYQHELQLFRRIIVETIHNKILENENNELKEYYQNEILENEKKLKGIENSKIREKVIENINSLKIKLSKMDSVITIPDLIHEIKNHKLLGEFFDKERMRRQSYDEREQLAYEKNLEAIKRNIYSRVVESLITPNIKDINLESLGLIKFIYPAIKSIELSDKFKYIFIDDKYDNFEKVKLEILNIFLYIFRDLRAITAEQVYFDEIKDKFSKIGLGQYITYNAKGKKLYNLKVTNQSFLYRFVASILRSFNLADSDENIHIFLEAIYETFLVASKRADIQWLEHKEVQSDDDRVVDAFRIVFYELGLTTPSTLYLNTINKTIWQNAVNNIVPEKNSIVNLKKVSQDYLNSDPYFLRYRNMYLKGIKELSMGLWAEEHSAQLSQKENRRLQNLFIQGKRNILSATTTLEVGIDIGGLSGVLMANIPPNKANYIQRSGRAGRRTDGSSITLTYAKTRHFDQNAFRNFKFYMEKPLKKLTISLEKEKVVIRHFNSFIFSKFYESYFDSRNNLVNSFNKMGVFVGILEIPKFTDNSYSKFDFEIEEESIYKKFILFLKTYKISDEDKNFFREIFAYTKQDFDYYGLLREFKKNIQEICDKYIDDVKELFNDWNSTTVVSHKNAIRYNIKQKHGMSLIEVFSNAQILPKYGFPIDVKSLQVINQGRDGKDEFELSRESFIALSEYVPGSKILAGGKLIESKGISKHFTGENLDEAFGENGFIYICSKGHFFTSQYIVHKCKMDGCEASVKPANYLIPKNGYITAASDKLSFKIASPKKIGRVKIHSEIYSTSKNDIVFEYDDFKIVYKEKTSIYGINKGEKGYGFAICTKCGYAESENGQVNKGSYDKLPTSFKKHASIYSESDLNRCLESHPTIWRNYNLMAKMVTDAIIIVPKREITDIKIAQTLANAMKLSGVDELGIDEREIASLVQEIDGKYILMFYDNQSGGVGYVYDLAKNRWNTWIEKTKERLFIDEKHNEECLNGCIKCVVTMNTNEPLPRKETLDYLVGKNNDIISANGKRKKQIIKPKISNSERLKKFKKI